MTALELIAAGLLAFSPGNAAEISQYAQIDGSAEYVQADTAKSEPKKSSEKNAGFSLPTKVRWEKNVDIGGGLRSNGVLYVGFMGTHSFEDTLAHAYVKDYGIGARVLLGEPNPNSGGLVYTGVGGCVEKYVDIADRRIPIRVILGGGIYNPSEADKSLEVNSFLMLETTAKIMNRKANLGFIFNKRPGFMGGLRFSF